MTKFKHTSGPWKYKNYAAIKNDKFIMGCYSNDRPLEENRANARLIATAPEMLEILINIYTDIKAESIKDIVEKATGLKIEDILK